MQDTFVLELPNLYDFRDNGKTIIHKCVQMKSTLILEEILEFYIKKYDYLLMLKSKESLFIEDFS
jgi:hypothetical protein